MKAFWEWLKSLFVRSAVQSPPSPIENVSPIPLPPQPPGKPVVPLSWEKNQPAREAWSVNLYGLVESYLSMLEEAKDIIAIRPDYANLNNSQKITVWCELFSAIAYYECGWDPKASSQDVGTSDKNTWSVGLLQLSVVDQESYKIPFGYNFVDLQDPYKNLRLGVAIMATIAAKHKKVLIPAGESGVYWATIHPGGKYDKTLAISQMVQKLSLASQPQPQVPPISSQPPIIPPVDNSGIPGRKWFLDRLGWTEYDHDAELSKGWVLTHYCKDYKTVIGTEHAWCGMSLATALHSDGYSYALDCEAASAWDDYGIAVDWKRLGIKLGDIICIRHASGGRHVTTAYRDHAIGELVADCLGGNQGDSICVKRYQLNPAVESHDTIVAVRRPVKA